MNNRYVQHTSVSQCLYVSTEDQTLDGSIKWPGSTSVIPILSTCLRLFKAHWAHAPCRTFVPWQASIVRKSWPALSEEWNLVWACSSCSGELHAVNLWPDLSILNEQLWRGNICGTVVYQALFCKSLYKIVHIFKKCSFCFEIYNPTTGYHQQRISCFLLLDQLKNKYGCRAARFLVTSLIGVHCVSGFEIHVVRRDRALTLGHQSTTQDSQLCCNTPS